MREEVRAITQHAAGLLRGQAEVIANLARVLLNKG